MSTVYQTARFRQQVSATSRKTWRRAALLGEMARMSVWVAREFLATLPEVEKQSLDGRCPKRSSRVRRLAVRCQKFVARPHHIPTPVQRARKPRTARPLAISSLQVAVELQPLMNKHGMEALQDALRILGSI